MEIYLSFDIKQFFEYYMKNILSFLVIVIVNEENKYVELGHQQNNFEKNLNCKAVLV